MLQPSSQPNHNDRCASASVPVASTCFRAGSSQYLAAFQCATQTAVGAFPYALNDYGVTVASPIQYEFGGPAETTVSLGLGVGALVISRDTINLKFKGRLDGKKRRLMGAEIALAAMLLSQTTAKKGSAVDLTAQGQQHEPTLPARSFTPIDRPSWLVQPNEDLVQLATMLFGQPEIGWLIADLNSGSIKQTFINGSRVVELKTDQRIELPVRQDILDFQKIALTCQSDNMITIVDQTAQFSLVALS